MVQHLIKPVCQGAHCWHPVPAPPDADPAFWRETCCQCARHRDRTRHMAPWLGHGPYTPTRRWVDDPPPGVADPSARATLARLAAVAGPASGVLDYCGRCGELAAWCTCREEAE